MLSGCGQEEPTKEEHEEVINYEYVQLGLYSLTPLFNLSAEHYFLNQPNKLYPHPKC
jgi:hypothetical protein